MSRKQPTSPDERRRLLDERRRRKMAKSALAFVRGSTERFYAWLGSSSAGALPQAPSIWICGDCHLGNIGPLGRADGAPVTLGVRDLDQATVGNPALDLVRLMLSLAMAARARDLPGATTLAMAEALVDGYDGALDGRARPAVDALPRPIKLVMKRALKRTWKQLFADRLDSDAPRRIRPGKRFWPLTSAERAAVAEMVKTEQVRRLVTCLDGRDDDGEVALLDAAFWVKGCSSLGAWRVAAVVGLGDGRACLLDIKEACPTKAPTASGARLPAHEGERVVAAARALSPALGERMAWSTVAGHPVFVRELLPEDLKLELDDLRDDDARAVASLVGAVVGQAHGRQLDDAARERWRRQLRDGRWLWQSVVELVALHERAYLEHCSELARASHET